MTVGEACHSCSGRDARPCEFTAYDGSTAGRRRRAGARCDCSSRARSRYLLTAPGDLGLARAYVHRRARASTATSRRSTTLAAGSRERTTGAERPTPPAPRLGPAGCSAARAAAAGGGAPRGAAACGTRRRATPRRSRTTTTCRTAFYELVLGPSMAYTCAVYPTPDATLEEAQATSSTWSAASSALSRACGCSTSAAAGAAWCVHAAKHYGVTAIGVTLSRASRPSWAQRRSSARARRPWPRSGTSTTATCPSAASTRCRSIGLTEHIGVANYPAYFRFLRDKLRDGGRLLNHCITRPDNRHPGITSRGFIDRYVFPDGELDRLGRHRLGHGGRRASRCATRRTCASTTR